MSTIKEIRKLIAKNNASKALKEAATLIENNEVLEDFENSIIGLQARLTAVEEGENDDSMDPRDIKIEKSKINKSLNFFLDKMEDEMPDPVPTPDPAPTPEPVPPPVQPPVQPNDPITALELEIKSLTEFISHNTNELTSLRDALTIESDPSREFKLNTQISKLEKGLDTSRTKLGQLHEDLEVLKAKLN